MDSSLSFQLPDGSLGCACEVIWDARGGVLCVDVIGAYSDEGSRWLTGVVDGQLATAGVWAVKLDLTNFAYKGGDVLSLLLSRCARRVPTVVVCQGLTLSAVCSLIAFEMDEDPRPWLHMDSSAAMDALARRRT